MQDELRHQLAVRFTDEQYAWLAQDAKDNERTISQSLRLLVNKARS